MMKVVMFCMWFCLVGVALMPFNGFSGGVNRAVLASGVLIAQDHMSSSQAPSRNLKEKGHHTSYGGSSGSDVSLEDYHPFDPSPSSKASIRPGPIQHGTPLMPYIPNPKPSPPRSSHDGLP